MNFRVYVILAKLALIGFVLVGCGERIRPATNTDVVVRDRPVPVLCKTEVERPTIPIDQAQLKQPLEVQNGVLRGTVATQRQYIARLEGAVIGCGGAVK